GDGWPCPDRNHASFLYRFGQTSILVDCGEPIDRAFKASGLSYDTFDRILISHLHSDHVGGFLMLMQGCWLEGRRKDLRVHLPGGAIRPLRTMLETVLIFDELLNFELSFSPLQPGRSFNVNTVQVTPLPTTHLDGLRAKFHRKHRIDFGAFSF